MLISLSSNTSVPVALYAVSDTRWRENTITWNTRPSTGALLSRRNLSGTSKSTYELDLTDYVKRELAAGRTVISVAMKQPFPTKIMTLVNSKEAGSGRPRLVLGTVPAVVQ